MALTDSQLVKPRTEDSFFSGMAIVILGIVILGFARSYYLAGAIHAPLPSRVIHVHAVVLSSWVLLFLAQTSLVTADRVSWHKKLGFLGGVLAFLVVVLGLAAAFDTQKRHAPIPGFEPTQILAIQIVELAVFSFLVTKGIGARYDPPAHKRLMLLAVISILGPAIARFPFAFVANFPPSVGLIIDVLLLSLFAFDWVSRHKIHRATIWGSLLIFVTVPVGFALSHVPILHRLTEEIRR